MPIPTTRFAIVVAVASIAMVGFGSWWGFAAVNAALVAVLLVDRALAPRPERVLVERAVPDVIGLGVPGTIRWHLTNATRRAVTVAFADQLAPSLGARTRRGRLRLGKGRSAGASTTFCPTRRGRFEIDTLTVRVEGPLGLAARQADRHRTDVLRVYPPYRSKDEAELRLRRYRIFEIGLRTARGRGGGTEFDQLREYTPDDEVKRIDWAATARAGKAIVRTYRAERNQVVINLLDNGRVMAARVDDVPRIEHAMDALMMLTAVSTGLGDRTGLVAFDSEVRSVVQPSSGRHQLGRVTEAMYDLEPQLAESDYLGAFTETLVRFRRRAMLVLYTDLVEQAVSETLLPALPLIARSHLVVIASVQDPDVVRWARLTPGEVDDAYRMAAAVAAMDERRRITARLRGLGATVIDAPPGELAPRLADAYVSVKATGQLERAGAPTL